MCLQLPESSLEIHSSMFDFQVGETSSEQSEVAISYLGASEDAFIILMK